MSYFNCVVVEILVVGRINSENYIAIKKLTVFA